jgi:signal transduction histidine kinase
LFAACAGICYTPHVLTAWSGSPQAIEAKYAEILVFFAIGGVTGLLSQRERNRRLELQEASAQLKTANTRLRNSFDQLKRADRLSAIGQLAASLAHEIRNPLASIEGAIDIADRTKSEERRREFLGVIKKETKRLNGLLTNLLDFARPRPPQIRQVRIESIVEPVVRLTAHNAQQRGIELESEVANDVPLVECDAEQITQAVLNVTLNALQATPPSGTVRLLVESQGNKILIRIRDEGEGIDEATLEKIFDPFFTTREGGTGLGLPISQQILAQHDGRITVERNRDRGMTFVLELPVRQKPSE